MMIPHRYDATIAEIIRLMLDHPNLEQARERARLEIAKVVAAEIKTATSQVFVDGVIGASNAIASDLSASAERLADREPLAALAMHGFALRLRSRVGMVAELLEASRGGKVG